MTRAQLSAIAHDLRQPLHALNLFADCLAIKVRDPDVARLIAGILDAVDDLERQIRLFLQDATADSLPDRTVLDATAATASTQLPCAHQLILVVDDNAPARESLCTLLGLWGARVVAAESLAAALKQCIGFQHAPSLLITDLELGRAASSGLDAIEQIRHHFAAPIPSIVVTAHPNGSVIEAAALLEAHVLAKPVAPGKLRTLVTHKLTRRLPPHSPHP